MSSFAVLIACPAFLKVEAATAPGNNSPLSSNGLFVCVPLCQGWLCRLVMDNPGWKRPNRSCRLASCSSALGAGCSRSGRACRFHGNSRCNENQAGTLSCARKEVFRTWWLTHVPDVLCWRLQLACWGFLNEELFKRKATESKVENQVGNWMLSKSSSVTSSVPSSSSPKLCLRSQGGARC